MCSDSSASGGTLLLEFPHDDPDVEKISATIKSIAKTFVYAPDETRVYQSLIDPVLSCYLSGVEFPAEMDDLYSHVRECLGKTDSLEVSRLEQHACHQGASHGAIAEYNYVVRTNVAKGGEQELIRWYDEEHMAMLAAVPGTVRARRFISLDAEPRYYACYDLVAPKVIKSPEWLAVRETNWSKQVRPTFRDTRRVVSRRLMQIG